MKIHSLTDVSTPSLVAQGLVQLHVRVGEHTLAPGAELTVKGTALEQRDIFRLRNQGAIGDGPHPRRALEGQPETATMRTGAPFEHEAPSVRIPSLSPPPTDVMPYAAARETLSPEPTRMFDEPSEALERPAEEAQDETPDASEDGVIRNARRNKKHR